LQEQLSEFKAKGKDVTLEILNNSLLAVQGVSSVSVNALPMAFTTTLLAQEI